MASIFYSNFPTPPAFGISKFVIPPCSRNSKTIIVSHLPIRIFHFLSNPSELLAGFANMPDLAYFTLKYFKWLYFCTSVQLVTEGVVMTPKILKGKL